MTPEAHQPIEYLRRFRLVAYALVFLSILGFWYAEGNFLVLFFGGLGCALSWWMVESGSARPLPRWLINVGVLLGSFLLFYELVIAGEQNLLLALGHFMIAILVCKLFETKHNRDFAQILTLTLLVMVAGAIFGNQSITFGLILGTYLVIGVYAILVFHLRFDTERALAGGSAPAEVVMSPEGQKQLRRDMRRMALRVGSALTIFAVGLFVLFPRSKGRDLLSTWSLNRNANTTGFTDRVRFGDFGRLAQSDALAMEVRLEQEGVNVGSEFNQPYFRGLTFDRYDPTERQWRRQMTLRRGSLTEAGDRELIPPGRYSPRGLLHQHYTLHASTLSRMDEKTEQILFSAGSAGVMTPAVKFQSEQLGGVAYSLSDFTLTSASAPSPVEYDVDSAMGYRPVTEAPGFLAEPGDLGMVDGVRSTVSPQITELAQQVGGALFERAQRKELSPDEIRGLAERYGNYLRSTYPYSLEYRQVDRRLDPTTDFLVNRKSSGGHCEYFASAQVMLCRAAGLNARMVTGYHGGEYNAMGGFYVVKQKFAHAWSEVMVPGRGWTTVDASPAAAEGAAGWAPAWLKSVREFMEVIQKNWLSRIVAFDAGTRRYILDNVSGAFQSATDWVKRTSAETWDGLQMMFLSRGSSWAARISAGVGLLMAGAGTWWLARRWHRRRTSHVAQIIRQLDAKTQRQLSIELEFFDDLLRVLGKTGVSKPAEATPREYVDLLSPKLRRSHGEAQKLVELFYAIRFGQLHVTARQEEGIRQALQVIRQDVLAG